MDNRKGEFTFRAQEMGVIYDQSSGRADSAHRHDYYTLLLVDHANGTHAIDYTKFSFGKHEVHFVSPGQVHQVVLSTKPKGKVITFTKDFLVENNIQLSFISNFNLFQNFGETPPLKLDPQTFDRLDGLVREMHTCLSVDMTYGSNAIGALLQLFLIYCSNSSKLDKAQISEDSAGICILREFKELVDNSFKNWHKVKDYATQMHITPKHLSQTIKNFTGKVAKDHIQDRIVLEAKRLLLHTTSSIKEIAYEVGFEEPLHFSSFFKKNVGVPPSKFRNK